MAGSAVAEGTDGAGQDGVAAELNADFNRELLTIEEQVNSLKERVFRPRRRCSCSRKSSSSSSGSRSSITHVNKLGRSYTIESISYYLDGQGKFSKVDTTGGLDAKKEIQIFEGPIPPGNHNITVHLKLRGNGFGVFSYVSNYVFNVQASTAFVAEDGKSCKVKAVVNERGGISRSFTERPSVVFENLLHPASGRRGR